MLEERVVYASSPWHWPRTCCHSSLPFLHVFLQTNGKLVKIPSWEFQLNQVTPLLLPVAWLQLSSAQATTNAAENFLALLKEKAERAGEGPSVTSLGLSPASWSQIVTQKIHITPHLAHALLHWTAYSLLPIP